MGGKWKNTWCAKSTGAPDNTIFSWFLSRFPKGKKCSFQWIGFGPDQRIFEFFLHTWPVWHLNWLFNWKQEFLDQYFVAKIRKQICIFSHFLHFFRILGEFFKIFSAIFLKFPVPGARSRRVLTLTEGILKEYVGRGEKRCFENRRKLQVPNFGRLVLGCIDSKIQK